MEICKYYNHENKLNFSCGQNYLTNTPTACYNISVYADKTCWGLIEMGWTLPDGTKPYALSKLIQTSLCNLLNFD